MRVSSLFKLFHGRFFACVVFYILLSHCTYSSFDFLPCLGRFLVPVNTHLSTSFSRYEEATHSILFVFRISYAVHVILPPVPPTWPTFPPFILLPYACTLFNTQFYISRNSHIAGGIRISFFPYYFILPELD